jgi:hypothetical protein
MITSSWFNSIIKKPAKKLFRVLGGLNDYDLKRLFATNYKIYYMVFIIKKQEQSLTFKCPLRECKTIYLRNTHGHRKRIDRECPSRQDTLECNQEAPIIQF